MPLSEHYRVIRVDLRGHGASPGGEPYDVPTLARDATPLLADPLGPANNPACTDPTELVGCVFCSVVVAA